MHGNPTRALRRPLTCLLLAACMPFPSLLAFGQEDPPAIVEAPDLEAQAIEAVEDEAQDDEGRPSACRKLAIVALLAGVAAYMGGFFSPTPALEPIQPGPALDLGGMTLNPAPGAWLGDPTPARLVPGPVPARISSGTVPCASDELPEPRTFRLVQDPKRIPTAKALRAFSRAAHLQYIGLLRSAPWTVTRHRWNRYFLEEASRSGVSLPALTDAQADDEVSRRIFEMHFEVRAVLQAFPSFAAGRGESRSGRPRGVDLTGSLAAIVAAEARLNAIYTEFLRFAREVRERDRTRTEPPSWNRDDLAAEARTLERTLEALEAAGIGG